MVSGVGPRHPPSPRRRRFAPPNLTFVVFVVGVVSLAVGAYQRDTSQAYG